MEKKATAAAPSNSAQKAARSAPAKKASPAAPGGKKAQAVKATPAKAPAAKAPAANAGQAPAEQPPAPKAAPKTTAKASSSKQPAPAGAAKEPAPRPAKEATKTVAVKKADAPAAKKADSPAAKKTETAPKGKAKGDRAAFLAEQRRMLIEERQEYMSSAEALKAQADSLALEHEPGDVQFDEEGGEGGTANVDREIDLYLSAQARATVVEIDRALQKIEDGTYGICEQCGATIPDARLQALPYAALCVTCKSGGLSSRR